MYPIICQLGPVSIYSYGLMLAIAVVVCTWKLSRDANAVGIKTDVIYDMVFYGVLSGLIGGRLFYILLHVDFFLANPSEMIMVQNGGLAWQGAIALSAIVVLRFIRIRSLDTARTLDLIAPYGALGQAIGRLGCFLNGCCYGKTVSWGIYFPLHGAYLHPTQLYLSLGNLIAFFIIRRYQKLSKAKGSAFALYLMCEAAIRFSVEFFRADHYSTLFGLSIYQYISLALFLITLYVFTRLKNQR